MAASILQEYLVSIGWRVDHAGLRKMDDALRHMADSVNKYTNHPLFGIAPAFLKAGAVVTGVLAGITAGTIGVMTHAANMDLQFQVLGRRMFMSADAMKHMKLATDALGYSIEDIIVGPKELKEHYRILMEDQKRMETNLGGVSWENQMVKIREAQFQLQRFGVEVQYFGFQLAGTVAKAIFGDKGDLISNLQQMNEWFQAHIPEMADKVTHVLVPALKLVYHVLEDILKVIEFVDKSPLAQKLIGYGAAGAVGGAAAGSVIPGAGTITGGLIGGAGGVGLGLLNDMQERQRNPTSHPSKAMLQAFAMAAAKNAGIDPQRFMNLIQTESGWNVDAVNKSTGAFGLGQFMPETAKRYGVVPGDWESNLFGAAKYLHDLGVSGSEGWEGALKKYGGFKTTDPSGYIEKITKTPYKPTAYQPGAGGEGGLTVNVNVAGTNASAQDIANVAMAKYQELRRAENQRMQAQLGASYA